MEKEADDVDDVREIAGGIESRLSWPLAVVALSLWSIVMTVVIVMSRSLVDGGR